MIDDVKSAKFFLDNVYFWKLGIVDDNGVDDDDDDDESNSYLDPGLQKNTCRLLCHGERSLNATTASSSSSSLYTSLPTYSSSTSSPSPSSSLPSSPLPSSSLP